jgi:hypothetical protein
VPGREEQSWERFYEQGSEMFFNGTFGGAYQRNLITEFEMALPAKAPWQK